MLSILEMLVKFSLQFNFLDRRLKNHKLKFHSCCFFKFSNFCKISRAPAISLHSDNKFPSCLLRQQISQLFTAVINLRGVSTNKTIICFIAMQTYKELIFSLLLLCEIDISSGTAA